MSRKVLLEVKYGAIHVLDLQALEHFRVASPHARLSVRRLAWRGCGIIAAHAGPRHSERKPTRHRSR
jgi:hypothetical protein